MHDELMTCMLRIYPTTETRGGSFHALYALRLPMKKLYEITDYTFGIPDQTSNLTYQNEKCQC